MKEPWISASIGCPFYLWTDKKTITCEGHTAGIKARTIFPRAEECSKYLRDVCGENFKTCPTFQAAMKKYEDIE